jgi:hypothetical protein
MNKEGERVAPAPKPALNGGELNTPGSRPPEAAHPPLGHGQQQDADDTPTPEESDYTPHRSSADVQQRQERGLTDSEIDEHIDKWTKSHPWIAHDQELIGLLREHLAHPRGKPLRPAPTTKPDPKTGVLD